jgi:hypothetical protein
MIMVSEPIEIDVTGLLEKDSGEGLIADIGEAVDRAYHHEHTTWLTYDGLRCAAIVPLEVGRMMDKDEIPPPGLDPQNGTRTG